jgi:hypothetical protein
MMWGGITIAEQRSLIASEPLRAILARGLQHSGYEKF